MANPRIIAGIVAGLLIGGVAAAFAVVWRPAIAAIEPPAPQSFDAGLVKRGRELAAIGNCNDCHTLRGGKAFAGGLPVPTPFGTIYSSNITPDPDTGIGRWSEAAFRRAMRSGVDRAGQHLYPTFPYDHFTNVTDEDDRALYAFLMTRPAVNAPARVNDLAFPLNQRFVVAGWKLLFLRHETYQPDSGAKRGMESRRLSGRRAGALRRMPYPAQCPGRGAGQRVIFRRRRRQLACLRDQRAVAFAGALGHRGAVPLSSSGLASRSWRRARADGRSCQQPVVGAGKRCARDRGLYGKRVRPADARSPPPGQRCAGANQVASAASVPDRHAAGASIYSAACASCHETDRPLPYGGVNLASHHRPQRSRSTQRRQHCPLGHSPRGGRAQPDHAGFCQQHDRPADCGPAELSALPLQQPTAMDRR